MQKKSLQTILYSTAGVAVMLVILIAFNFIAGTARARLDLTQEKAFTLSAGTRAILEFVGTHDRVAARSTTKPAFEATPEVEAPVPPAEASGEDLKHRFLLRNREANHTPKDLALAGRCADDKRGWRHIGRRPDSVQFPVAILVQIQKQRARLGNGILRPLFRIASTFAMQ